MQKSKQKRLAERTPLKAGPYEAELIEHLESRGLFKLVSEVALSFYIPPFEVVGRSLRTTPSRARHELWRRLKDGDEFGFSYNEIASLFDRDHTTIMTGVKKARARIAKKNGATP